MTAAVVATILWHKMEGGPVRNTGLIIAAILSGTAAGWIIALRVKMTAMPQLVSFFNGMGGGCAALISILEFPSLYKQPGSTGGTVIVVLVAMIIGSISLSGSIIAYGKLDGWIADVKKSWYRYMNFLFLALVILTCVLILAGDKGTTPAGVMTLMLWLAAFSILYGVFFVLPIGGADMPVVISLLNSFTGIAAAMGGLLYNNQVMLTGGILVGSAGTILTGLMCRAMNRSLVNVIFGTFGNRKAGTEGTAETGSVSSIQPDEAAMLLNYSRKVAIIPGFGLAAAQAQHVCSELDRLLTERGIDVYYAIHPVAGRMPGHMNVLLAEADVPYDKLKEMEDSNAQMPDVDVAIVVGANDVVNPAALEDPESPIYGMPIIHAHEARHVIVLKRGMGKGYAAIENSLFYDPKTRMLFGNAKETLQKLVNEIKKL
jgi:NAD(P) transhydrogenase subunit beta